jgi:hypothetical protein
MKKKIYNKAAFKKRKIGEPRVLYMKESKSLPIYPIVCGDALDVLKSFPDECINLIVTLPAYADRRVNTYGGIPPENCTSWFIPIADELKRVLKLDGASILNIKEKADNGERCRWSICTLQ